MKYIGMNDLRRSFLEFFKERNHYIAPSYSLVPQSDKSLLFINAGMVPLKPYFVGTEEPPSKRMATCQKCVRTNDIENVGVTARHCTFFEMLGNFSFGDYFKEESLRWGWEFSTEVLGFDPDKIWATVYYEDEESKEIWKKIGMAEDHIVPLGKEDNFWEIGVGPCGPDSELHYDRGEAYGCGKPDCKPGCDCDRYLEYWNHVFTQFDKNEEGEYLPLENKNIDTGMGLERIACITQGVDSVFDIDVLKTIRDAICKKANVEYGKDSAIDTSIRIITDHSKAVTFMVGDGIMFNNEGRGYVLRRLLRRASRHGKLLGIEGNFIVDLIDVILESYGEAYPNLIEKQDFIKKNVAKEEERFQVTIDQGLSILNEYIDGLIEKDIKVLSGEDAFRLYDTYGFPLDLTKEILEEKNLSVDEDSFAEEMEKQKNRARSARKDSDEGWKDDALSSLDSSYKSTFKGYTDLKIDGKITAIATDKIVENLSEGDEGIVILDETAFYPEGGGQQYDTGVIRGDNFEFTVKEVKKGPHGMILHHGVVKKGTVLSGATVQSEVDQVKRLATSRNHSATHLLHKALQMVLGSHVEQKGSMVNNERLRFDFSHLEAMTSEEIKEVETLVNSQIFMPNEIMTNDMSIEEAKARGAMALFGEKYGDTVRVVEMGDFSIELCGGTHLKTTAEIGMFKIMSESGVASGVRRIEAITGQSVYQYLNQKEDLVSEIVGQMKTKEQDVVHKVGQMMQEVKELEKANADFKKQLLSSNLDDITNSVEDINGINVIMYKFEEADTNAIRDIGDQLVSKFDPSVIILANDKKDKADIIVMASKAAIDKGAHSGNIVKEVAKICKGGGGGRPNMAQAGGKDPSKIGEGFAKAKEIISQL